MFMYVSLALVAITVLIVLVNLIKGLIRGFKKTVGTLAAIIISAVIAAIVTAMICTPQSAMISGVMDSIGDLFTEDAVREIFGIAELAESLSYYLTMIIAPFVFMLLYIVLSIIVAIIVGIVIKFIPPHKKPKAVIHRLGGLGVGVVCGILVSALLLMPIVGVLDIAISVGTSDTLASEDGENELTQILEEASEDKLFAVYSGGTGWMFDSISSVTYKDGKKVMLRTEANVIVAVLANIGSLSGDISTLETEQVAALNKTVTEMDASPLLKNAFAGVLSNMASKWIADEQFAGIERIDAGDLLDPIICKILEVLATTTDETLTSDMRTLVDILGVMSEHKLLENADSFEEMLKVLSSDNGEISAIEELILVANENPRMTGLADEITRLSIRALASTLGIPADRDENYDMLMSDIAAVLNDSANMSERSAYAEAKLVEVFDEYGVEIGGDAATNITNSLLEDFGDEAEVKSDAVKEFFMMYAIASGDINNETAGSNASDLETLASGRVNISADPTTGVLMLDDYVFKYYDAYTYSSSAAYNAGKLHLDFGAGNTLYSPDAMVSTVITLEDILNARDEHGAAAKKFSELSREEAQAEARKFSEMLSMVKDTFGDDFSNIDHKSMIKNMGGVLDKMSEMQTLGDAATAELVKAIFNSDSVKNNISIPASQLEKSAQDLIDNARSENGSYASATKAVGGMLEMIDKVNDKNISKEEKIETTRELMDNMTPENAQMLSNMTTPELIRDYVKDEQKAQPVSDSVSSLFHNMSNFSTQDEQAYKREAEAVNTMLNLAMGSSESEHRSMFTKRDENNNITEHGKMDVDAEEFVALVANSEVVSKTFADTVATGGENPYGIHPSAEDEAELSAALSNHYASEKDSMDQAEREELKSTLENIALLTNITVPELN